MSNEERFKDLLAEYKDAYWKANDKPYLGEIKYEKGWVKATWWTVRLGKFAKMIDTLKSR